MHICQHNKKTVHDHVHVRVLALCKGCRHGRWSLRIYRANREKNVAASHRLTSSVFHLVSLTFTLCRNTCYAAICECIPTEASLPVCEVV